MIQVQQTTPPLFCPYCREGLSSRLAGIRCAGCGTIHHEICWAENDFRCSVFYCAGIQTLPVNPSEMQSVIHVWFCRAMVAIPVAVFAWFLSSWLIPFPLVLLPLIGIHKITKN